VPSTKIATLAAALCFDVGAGAYTGPLDAGEEPTSEAGSLPAAFEPSPLLYAEVDGDRLVLVWAESATLRGTVTLVVNGAPGAETQVGTPDLPLPAEDPATIAVRAGGAEWVVPVIGRDGSVARIPLPPPATFDDGLRRLLTFPVAWEEDEAAGDEADGDAGDGSEPSPDQRPDPTRARGPERRTYALHTAAELVEQLAQRLQTLSEAQLPDFVRHLELEAPKAFPPEELGAWRELRHDFLAVLATPAFAPSLGAAQRKTLLAALGRILNAWGIDGARLE
jgi:hypothetical protein